MRKAIVGAVALLLVVAAGAPVAGINAHPRIWLTSDMLASVRAKKDSNDADYLRVKAIADATLPQKVPSLTITAATNSNPVTFTTIEPVFWTGTSASDLYLKGGTGAWGGVNNAPETWGYAATRTGPNTFTVPVDSSSFGSFIGQRITVFKAGDGDSGFLGYGYQGNGWQDALLSLALVYKVTGTSAYATKALAILDWINTLGAARMISPVSQDSGRADMATTLTVAITYDWLYELLSTQQKAATVATLNLWNDWTVNNAYGRGDPTSNYWEAHVTAASAVGYATYGDNTRAQEWIDWATNQWTTYFAPKFFNAPTGVTSGYEDPAGFFYNGGLAVIGWNYGGNDIGRHVKYMEMVRTATGLTVPNGLAYAQSWARALPYQLKPDRVKTPTWGRWTGDWYGVYTKSGPLMLTHFLEGTLEGAWVQWFYTHYGSSLGFTEQVETAYDRLLFYKASRTATDYRLTEPTYKFSDGLAATMFWRSDWSDTADYCYFNASTSNAAAELPKDAGHIDVTRGGDYLLVQSNMWKGTGDGSHGNPSMENYSSALANTLYFYDGGTKCFDRDDKYDGCQSGFGIYKAPKVKLTPTYGFAENEFATAYDYAQVPSARTLQYFIRSFMSMGDGVYVISDRVQSTSAAHTKQIRWQLSSASTPTASNGVVTSIVGSSKVLIDTVLPASQTINIVRNVTGSNAPANWRAEVTDAAPSARYTGLTVIYATGATGTLPSVSRLTTINSNFEGVQIGGAAPKVAVVPKGATAKGDGTFSSSTYAASSFTSTHAGTGRYLVAGLAPGTYAVTLNGAPLSGATSIAVDGSGVLSVTAPSGAFSITQTSGTVPTPPSDPTPTDPTPTLASLTCSPASVTSGSSATCAVTLSGAVTTPLSVSLGSSSGVVSVPSSVTVLVGAAGASFTAGAANVSSDAQTATVSASLNGVTRTASMTVAPATTPDAGTYTCTNGQFVMTSDITLRNQDTVELVGAAGARCAVTGNNHRFIVADTSWIGHFRMQNVDVYDLGTASLDVLGGVASGNWAYIGGDGYIDIQNSSFHRSSGFNLLTYGNSSVVFSRNVYHEDNLVPVSAALELSRPWFKEAGTSTAPKFMQGNRLSRSWLEVGSPNWTVGAARGCTSTCDSDGNIMIGRRIGFAVTGAGSYVSYNYSHLTLDVTPDSPTWSQVANVHTVGAGVVVENNVIRSGQWVAQGVDGDLSRNVLLEISPHHFVRIGNGGLIHHNILIGLYPGLDRYTFTARLGNGDGAFGLVQTGNNLSVYNNTLDARASAVAAVLEVMEGATVNSFRNNAVYRLTLSAANCPAGPGCTSAVGGTLNYQDVGSASSPRALYVDYNSFFYDPASPRRVTYSVGVLGKSLCQAGFGGHDLGTCPNASVDPQFRGPLPMGTGRSTLATGDDSGFPFNDADIIGGVYSVSQLLSYFRWVYAPGTSSPLLRAQDPQDGPGDIGAVQTATLPSGAPAIVTTNKRPMVYAGPSFSVADVGTAATLSGYAADDGLPSSSLALQWSVVSGPGTVSFDAPDRSITEAHFSVSGLYTLRLTADDGAIRSVSDAQIGVGVPVPGTPTGNGPKPPLGVKIIIR